MIQSWDMQSLHGWGHQLGRAQRCPISSIHPAILTPHWASLQACHAGREGLQHGSDYGLGKAAWLRPASASPEGRWPGLHHPVRCGSTRRLPGAIVPCHCSSHPAGVAPGQIYTGASRSQGSELGFVSTLNASKKRGDLLNWQ